MGLARARWTVQEDAALEVLAGRHQHLPVRSDAERVLAYPLQQALGQDDISGIERRPGVEGDARAARPEVLGREGQDLPLHHALALHPPAELREETGDDVRVRAQDLQGRVLPAIAGLGLALEEGHGDAVAVEQPKTERDGLPLLIRPDRQVGVVRL